MTQSNGLVYIILLLLVIPSVYSHETNEEHVETNLTRELQDLEYNIENQRSYQTDWTVILPFRYFAQGKWIVGLVVVAVWLLFLRAMYVLAMLLIARAS